MVWGVISMIIPIKKINQGLFTISYFLFLSFSIIGHIPKIGGYLNLLTNVGIVLLLLSALVQIKKYTKKELMILLVLFCFSIILISRCQDYILFKITIFLAAAKNIKIEKCIFTDFWIRLFLIVFTIILYKLNIAPDVISNYNGSTRHSLGFTNPNTLGMHILILCFDILCMSKYRFSVKKILIVILLVIFSDIFAGSRTTTYISILTIILMLIYHSNPHFLENKKIYYIIINSVLIMTLLTLGMYLLYTTGTQIGNLLNEALSNRLYNMDIYRKTYQISLLGNDNTNMGLTLDTAYAYCFFIYGIVAFFLLIIVFRKLFKKLYQTHNNVLIIIMFSFVIYGLSEKLWLSIDYNIFMIVFAGLLYSSFSRIEDENYSKKKIGKKA